MTGELSPELAAQMPGMISGGQSLQLPITDSSRVAEARRTVGRLAIAGRLAETDAGRAQIVATELANNLARHAREGVLMARLLREPEGRGVEIAAIDRGPGMDVERCLSDGYSTGGTPGTGLGAARRMSDLFDAYSLATGTVVVARVAARPAAPHAEPATAAQPMEIGGVCLAKTGEQVSGDAWAIAPSAGGRTLIVVADGLGHGPNAAAASAAALAAFHEQAPSGRGPADVLADIHRRLRSTRGAAVAVAELAPALSEIRFAGLGNIAAVVISGATRRGLVSQNGTAGATASVPREMAYPFPPRSLLVMASDGLGTHWDLGRYAGAITHRPSVISALLCRDFSRGRDDLTVIAAREAG
jgi:anti-sigma regulatory factor (Ser/Thr protein kinase)